jgi:hypothetical protein
MFRKKQVEVNPVVKERSNIGGKILFWVLLIIFISAIISQFVG